MRLSKIKKVWFDYPDDLDGSRFEIKHLLAGDIAKIDDQATKDRVEFVTDENGDPSVKTSISVKKELKSRLIAITCITDWENVKDENGEDLQYSLKNKERLCKELSNEDWNQFLMFLFDCRKTLSGQVAEQEEEALGN